MNLHKKSLHITVITAQYQIKNKQWLDIIQSGEYIQSVDSGDDS